MEGLGLETKQVGVKCLLYYNVWQEMKALQVFTQNRHTKSMILDSRQQ